MTNKVYPYNKQKVKKKVLCVGACTYDINFMISDLPEEDGKTTANSMRVSGGGPAANAAVTLSRLGLKSSFIGYVGNDPQGDYILKEFLKEGVNTDLILRGSEPTPVSVNLVKPEGNRYLVNYSKKKYFLNSGNLNLSKLDPDVMLFDGHEPNVAKDLIKMFSSSNIKTVLDAGSLHQGTAELIDKVDYLVCSNKFAVEYANTKNLDKALDRLLKLNSNTVITQGKEGLVWGINSKRGRIPALNIKAVDSTGAGDAFHGAFSYCLAEDLDWDFTLKFSSFIAAKCCLRLGARDGIPYFHEVSDYIIKDKIIPETL